MGQDPCYWVKKLKRPLWQCLNPFDAAADNMWRLHSPGSGSSGVRQLHTERWVFGAGRMNAVKQQRGGGVGTSSLLVPEMNSAFSRPQERKLLIFDQSGSRTTMIFSSMSPALHLNGAGTDMKESPPLVQAGTELAAGKTDAVKRSLGETMHASQGSKQDDGVNEEGDDIDALLYSDSEEEEGNTNTNTTAGCCSPGTETNAEVEGEEVASSGGPWKRRKLEMTMRHDDAVMDTASSTTTKSGDDVITSTACHGVADGGTLTKRADKDRSNCVNDGEGGFSTSPKVFSPPNNPKWAGAEQESNNSAGKGSGGGGIIGKMKRDHICETVNVLRGIIPGCKGKDACLVLDEAIKYLKSLELKVQSFSSGAGIYGLK